MTLERNISNEQESSNHQLYDHGASQRFSASGQASSEDHTDRFPVVVDGELGCRQQGRRGRRAGQADGRRARSPHRSYSRNDVD
jgi:hypothetical protein